MESDSEPVVLNAERAARRLGISPSALRKLDIPIARYAGRTLYRVEDLDEFIAAHVVEAA